MQDVAGALLELVVNARQVVTDDAQAQHQHATEKNEQQNNGGKAIERFTAIPPNSSPTSRLSRPSHETKCSGREEKAVMLCSA